MGKCALSVLGLPLELWPAIRDGEEIDPGQITVASCQLICTGCHGPIIRHLRRWSFLPTKGIVQPAPGWVGGISNCQ